MNARVLLFLTACALACRPCVAGDDGAPAKALPSAKALASAKAL